MLFSRLLKRLLNSKTAYQLLDDSNAGQVTWTAGGCWILAQALNLYLENAPIYVVYNADKELVEHFVVKINDGYIDGDGFQDETKLIKKMIEVELVVGELEILKYDKSLNTENLIDDIGTAKELAILFEKRRLPKKLWK